VIDDDGEVRTSLSFLLRSMNLHACPFSGGGDFLQGVDALNPGLVLLDMCMPDPDGLSVLRNLSERGVVWPVIAMTGHGDAELAVNARKLGAFHFLEKPFAEEELDAVLASAFVALRKRSLAGPLGECGAGG
jgi:FixJ family two-component response regulator